MEKKNRQHLNFGSLITGIGLKIKCNWKKLLAFTVLYSFVSVMFTDLLSTLCTKLCLLASGASYLGPDNLKTVLLNPISIILTLVFLIILSIFSLFGIGAVIFAFTSEGDFTFSDMLGAGLRVCKKCFYPKNYLIIPFVLILLPLNGVLILASPVSYLKVPGFVEGAILGNALFKVLYYVALVLLFVLVTVLIYSICYFSTEENCSFLCACKKSRELTKGKRIVSFFSITLYMIIIELIIIGLAAGISKIGADIIAYFSPSESLSMDVSRLNNAINIISMNLRGAIVPIINCGAISVLFLRFKKEKDEPCEDGIVKGKIKRVKTGTVIIVVVVAVLIVVGSVFVHRRTFSDVFAEQSVPEVVAHRGDSVYAPENTMPAFELAIEEGVDCIELDIHQTKDGVIMISHDDNLLRVSGEDVCVHELTYDEAVKLDVGSYFSPSFKGLHLSTLEELLDKVAPTDVNLQIEIKPTGYENHLEEQLLDLLIEKGMHDRVTVICLKSEPLIRLKELDPTINTAFCMFIAGQSIENIEFSDDFSIEETNATAELISNIHAAGKKCYVWTINSEENLQSLIDMGVDGIVTDNPMKMHGALLQADYSGGLMRYLSLAFQRLL